LCLPPQKAAPIRHEYDRNVYPFLWRGLFYGYDYGYYVGGYNSFSALYNDVLHGHHAPLQAFEVLLNAYRLLPSLEAVQRLDEARRPLIAGQAALETDEEFGPIVVYGYQG